MRKTKEKLPCAALPKCGKLAAKRGYCEGHYQQFKQGRPFVPLQPRGRNLGKLCGYGPCELPAIKVGYCSGHYQQIRGGRELAPLQDMGRIVQFICTFPGCTRPHEAHGYCAGHGQQLQAGKPLVPLQVMHSSCTFPGCDHPHEAHGYCYGHLAQRKQGRTLQSLTDTPSPIDYDGVSWRVALFGKDTEGRHGKIVAYSRISKEDIDIVKNHRWTFTPQGYARSCRRNHTIGVLMHRMIMQAPPDLEVDHINGIRLDNQRENLRLVTSAQQSQNLKVYCTNIIGIRGVSYDPKKKLYRVTVTVNGVKHSGRRHRSKEAADCAASKLRTELMTHTNEDREDIRKK